ncbi:MAG: hypothetical protein AB2777_21400 [Candidatus Thiodiazotropha endolucinida]
MEFWTALIKTPDDSEFLSDNCTHVVGEYWIFEGDNELLDDELSQHEIVAEGGVPCLGDLTTQQLIDGCADWYGVEFEITVRT